MRLEKLNKDNNDNACLNVIGVKNQVITDNWVTFNLLFQFRFYSRIRELNKISTQVNPYDIKNISKFDENR